MGVSPRRLFGFEPAKVTELHRDKSGRVFRVVTRTESEYSDADREMLLAYKQREAMKMPHGQPMDEVIDEHADPGYYGDGAYRYEVHYEIDQAQAAIERERARLKAQNPDIDLSAYVFWPTRKDYARAAKIVRNDSELSA